MDTKSINLPCTKEFLSFLSMDPRDNSAGQLVGALFKHSYADGGITGYYSGESFLLFSVNEKKKATVEFV